MKALILVFSILALCKNVRSAWPPGCKEDMIINDTCYIVYDSTATFYGAKLSCLEKGGILAIIKNSEVNEKIAEYIDSPLETNRMRTLILILSSVFTLHTHIQSPWPANCRDGMVVNYTCYVVYSLKETYNLSESMCEFRGGTLAIIKESETNSQISSFIKEEASILNESYSSCVWIGLNDLHSEGNFRYSNNIQLLKNDYQPWAQNRPNNHSWDNGDCVALCPDNQKWYKEDCGFKNKYVCQFKASSCDTQFINVRNGEFDNCYRSSDILFGFNVSIKCQEGYLLVGPTTVTCAHDGKWTQMPKCLKGCKPPPAYPNAKIMFAKDYYILDDVVTFTCHEGYFSKRNLQKTHFIISCSSDGSWTPSRSGCSRLEKYQIKGIEVTPNDIVKLICDVNKSSTSLNNSNGLYFWLKDSKYLSRSPLNYEVDFNGDLVVYDNSSETIEGLYTCFMNGEELIPGNTVYDVKHRKVIQCEEEPSDIKSHYVYKEGDSALLLCPHTTPYERFHWYRDGEYFQLNDDHVLYPDGSLYFRKIEFSHQGIYTCMMTIKDTSCSKNITAEVVVLVSSESICGNPEKSLSHPWIVSLWWKDEIVPFCYGALIHEYWVITTAHCLTGVHRKRKLSIFVRFGSDSVKDINSDEKDNSKIVDIPIATTRFHPLFSKKICVNDIALVKLKQPVQFTNTIQPICFTETDLTVKSPCDQSPPINGIAVGWGSLERDDFGEIALAEENLTYVPHDTCFPTESFYSDKVLCFEKTIGTKETFASDTGSPLEILWRDHIYLLGIYSSGDRAVRLGKYDYFTKISTYVPWFSTFIEEE